MTDNIDAQWREDQLNMIDDYRRQLARAHDERWFYVDADRPAQFGDAVTPWSDPARFGVITGFDVGRYLALVRWPDCSTEWRAIGSLEPVAPRWSPVA
jgi:hypothetical protein